MGTSVHGRAWVDVDAIATAGDPRGAPDGERRVGQRHIFTRKTIGNPKDWEEFLDVFKSQVVARDTLGEPG